MGEGGASGAKIIQTNNKQIMTGINQDINSGTQNSNHHHIIYYLIFDIFI
jgi:hypothetical protein